MVDPTELWQVARLLLGVDGSTASEEQLRRSISTAYYSVFHAVSGKIADQLVGKDHRTTAAYALVYRSLDHRRMKTVCRAVDADRLPAKYAAALKCDAVSSTWRDFAATFVTLQDRRHSADYDPHMAVDLDGAMRLCLEARFARLLLYKAATDLVDPVLALMAFGTRD